MSAILLGILASAAGAACALLAVALLKGRGLNGALAGFTIGFLARAALLGAGLAVTLSRHEGPLAFVAAFFAVYVPTQTLEVLIVVKHKGAKA